MFVIHEWCQNKAKAMLFLLGFTKVCWYFHRISSLPGVSPLHGLLMVSPGCRCWSLIAATRRRSPPTTTIFLHLRYLLCGGLHLRSRLRLQYFSTCNIYCVEISTYDYDYNISPTAIFIVCGYLPLTTTSLAISLCVELHLRLRLDKIPPLHLQCRHSVDLHLCYNISSTLTMISPPSPPM